MAAAHPGQVWASITAYGRTGPWSDRIGFGDDAAAAGGLVVRDAEGPLFCADAVADPLAGLCAAAGVLDAVAAGGGLLVDVALREVARAAAPARSVEARPAVGPLGDPVPLASRRGGAPDHGADTRRVLAELGLADASVDEAAR